MARFISDLLDFDHIYFSTLIKICSQSPLLFNTFTHELLLPVVSFTAFPLAESRDGVVARSGAAAAPANGPSGRDFRGVGRGGRQQGHSGGRTSVDSAQYPLIFLSFQLQLFKLFEI